MAKRIIKPDSGNTLVLQEDNGSIDALTVEINGNTTLGGNLVIPDSGTIGSQSDTDAITIDSSGNAEFSVSVKTDTISEKSADTGVTIDGTLIKDNTIKPASGQDLILKDDAGNSALEIGTTSGSVGVYRSITGANARIAIEYPGNERPAIRTYDTNATATSYAVFDIKRNNSTVGSIACTNSATSFNTSSDYRLKENVTPLTSAIDRLNQLKPSRFNFIADPDTTLDGFLAHEVSDFVPEAVTGEKDAVDENGDIDPQGIDQSKLVPLLTAALKESIALIESQQSQIDALIARIEALENAAG